MKWYIKLNEPAKEVSLCFGSDTNTIIVHISYHSVMKAIADEHNRQLP